MLRKVIFLLPMALLVATGVWADDLEELREKLAREDDPSKRARIQVKIGEELLQQTQDLYREETFDEARTRLGEYLDTVSNAFDELQQSGRDARKKPRGFKDLEVHLRKSRRRLEDTARAIPYEMRGPVETAMDKLRSMRTDLLYALMGLEPPKKEGT